MRSIINWNHYSASRPQVDGDYLVLWCLADGICHIGWAMWFDGWCTVDGRELPFSYECIFGYVRLNDPIRIAHEVEL